MGEVAKALLNKSSSNLEGKSIEDTTWVCDICNICTPLEEFYCSNGKCYNSWFYCMS